MEQESAYTGEEIFLLLLPHLLQSKSRKINSQQQMIDNLSCRRDWNHFSSDAFRISFSSVVCFAISVADDSQSDVHRLVLVPFAARDKRPADDLSTIRTQTINSYIYCGSTRGRFAVMVGGANDHRGRPKKWNNKAQKTMSLEQELYAAYRLPSAHCVGARKSAIRRRDVWWLVVLNKWHRGGRLSGGYVFFVVVRFTLFLIYLHRFAVWGRTSNKIARNQHNSFQLPPLWRPSGAYLN